MTKDGLAGTISPVARFPTSPTEPGAMSQPIAVDTTAQTLWVLDELAFTWREAQKEAVSAYCHWRRVRDRTTYAIYRAAQDRADAAQDALHERWHVEQANATS
jgi:hypothetical protein